VIRWALWEPRPTKAVRLLLAPLLITDTLITDYLGLAGVSNGLAAVFVMSAPPLVWGGLGPTGWGIFPGFLTAEGSEVEESPDVP
jgi:hypothetical protein